MFYKQERIGQYKAGFKLIKFATMLKDSPNLATGTITVKDDRRILPLGKVLRKTKINELPQLINVLAGDMSLIGPRPLTKENFCFYPEKTQNVIAKIKPGLSGVGSVIFSNEEAILDCKYSSIEFYKAIIAPYKGLIEVWFVRNRGMKLYFVTIAATLLIIAFRGKKQLVWRIFRGLPAPPEELKESLAYR